MAGKLRTLAGIFMMVVTGGLLTILTSDFLWAAESQAPIRALQRSPWLEDYFPYGFWYA